MVGLLGGGWERKCARASWVVRIGWVRLMSREAKRLESRESFEAPVPGGCQKLEKGLRFYQPTALPLVSDSRLSPFPRLGLCVCRSEENRSTYRFIHAGPRTYHIHVSKLLPGNTEHPLQMTPFPYICLLETSPCAPSRV